MRRSTRMGVFARRALVGAVAAGFVLTLAATVSPGLHHHFHHDASQPGHACLATSLQGGKCGTVVATVVAVVPTTPFDEVIPPRGGDKVESFYLSCRLLERGPPLLLPS